MAPRVKGMTRPVGLLVVMRARVGVLALVVVLEGGCGDGEEDMEEEKKGCMCLCLWVGGWMVVMVVYWRVYGYVGGCRLVAVEGGGEGRMKAPVLL